MINQIIRKTLERIYGKMNASALSPEQKAKIESIVDDKIKEFGLDTPRFDLIKFLKEKENFEIVLQRMPDDTTGLIIINDNEIIQGMNTHKLIAVNDNLQKDPNYIQRRRFIVAHEYAHSILHKNQSVLFAHRDTDKKDTYTEQEADFFARCLLMPRSLIESVKKSETYNKLSDSEKIPYICQIFNVTEKKAKQRLKELESNA